MGEYEINLRSDPVKGLLTSDEGFKGLVETVVNSVLEPQMSEHLAVMALPEEVSPALATTNMQERLNEEVRRREKVIRIFPNKAGAMRLIGALPAEKHETWLTGLVCVPRTGRQGSATSDMTEFHEWQDARLKQPGAKVRSIK